MLFGRLTEIEGSAEQVDAMLDHLRGSVIPGVKEMAGSKGFITLVDRDSGKAIGISLWENREAMVEARNRASQLRSDSAQAAGGDVAGVGEYEIAIDERF
ncbi:MAG TPA: hypothetical protein VHM89_09755 [Acidimicrobiales bacterium]|nr:hypothetical protein [Acidimicrobiales bacterium]